jgi:5'-AMP-activated protein kinase regulatory gamma subunit
VPVLIALGPGARVPWLAGVVVDIYAKHDVINLARDGTYHNLDTSVATALQHRQEGFEGVQTCTLDTTLGEVRQHGPPPFPPSPPMWCGDTASPPPPPDQIIDKMIAANVHRLVVTDESRRLNGIVSLSDVLLFLVG